MLKPPLRFGSIDNLNEGDLFAGQAELFHLQLYRDRQQGIYGRASEGAESVILSGGYEDDEDFGDEIIYTGMSKGTWDRENRTTKADQTLTGPNLALIKNEIEGIPVRVFRSHKHKSTFSPSEGIQYAGLFYVVQHWHQTNDKGHIIYRFLLRRQPKQANRRDVVREEVVRYRPAVDRLKELYKHQCQFCGTSLRLPGGPYIECCHIQPLGRPHDGPDTIENMLCLCPNHHVMFDFGACAVSDDFQLIGLNGRLHLHAGHVVGAQYLRYHREVIADPVLREAILTDSREE
jgi:putative restriction endonuclease